MNISEFLNRYKWWLVLAVLLIFNVIRYWPVKHTARTGPGGPPDMARGFPTPDADMQAKIDALPDDQKQAVNDWMRQQKDFFASVQSLPDDQKQQKMMEHFSQDPPPPGMPFPGPGGPPPGGGPDGSPPPGGGNGGPGGPGNGGPGGPGGPGGNGGSPGDGTPHIPPPGVRRGMDQGLVNAMKGGGFQ